MQITIDTTKPLSDLDKALIQGLLGEAARTVVTEPAEKPAPAKRPAAKPAAKPAPKPEPEPEPEDEEDEDLVGGNEDAVSKEDLVELVTSLAANGHGKAIKAILTKNKAGKVSELTEDKYAAVYADLQAL